MPCFGELSLASTRLNSDTKLFLKILDLEAHSGCVRVLSAAFLKLPSLTMARDAQLIQCEGQIGHGELP